MEMVVCLGSPDPAILARARLLLNGSHFVQLPVKILDMKSIFTEHFTLICIWPSVKLMIRTIRMWSSLLSTLIALSNAEFWHFSKHCQRFSVIYMLRICISWSGNNYCMVSSIRWSWVLRLSVKILPTSNYVCQSFHYRNRKFVNVIVLKWLSL